MLTNNTHAHSRWISSVLLRLSWATQNVGASTPQGVMLVRLLMCCSLLGSPVGGGIENSRQIEQYLFPLCSKLLTPPFPSDRMADERRGTVWGRTNCKKGE